MNKKLLLGAAMAGLLIGGTPVVYAEDSAPATATPALGDPQAIDAAEIVGQNIYDMQGATVGEIDAVMVDASGSVQSVVVDASGWLESEKLLSLNWSELTRGPDGQIVATKLTKEQAQLAEGYVYRGNAKGGQVLTEDGEPYGKAADAGTASGMDDEETGQDAIVNSDGTFNTSNVIGAAVENATGDKLGEVNEIVVQPDGKISGVVLDVGGLLGVGARSVMLDWDKLELVERDGRDVLMTKATEESLEAMPEYKRPTGN